MKYAFWAFMLLFWCACFLGWLYLGWLLLSGLVLHFTALPFTSYAAWVLAAPVLWVWREWLKHGDGKIIW